MNTAMPLSDSLGKYLDLSAAQLKLTAGNVANVDTPGYHTLGIDFEQEFARAMLTGSSSTSPQPKASEVDGLIERPDGNNVSLDREGMEMAKAQLEFRTGVTLLKIQFAQMLSAIHAP